MIVDRIENASLYYGLSTNLADALSWLSRQQLASLPDGRLEIDGDRIFALLQSPILKTKDQAIWEAHRKYMDIHAVFEGEERIAYANLRSVTAGVHDASKDFTPVSGEGNEIVMKPGEFMILMPQDAHATTLAVTTPVPIRKVVMKVAVT